MWYNQGCSLHFVTDSFPIINVGCLCISKTFVLISKTSLIKEAEKLGVGYREDPKHDNNLDIGGIYVRKLQ